MIRMQSVEKGEWLFLEPSEVVSMKAVDPETIRGSLAWQEGSLVDGVEHGAVAVTYVRGRVERTVDVPGTIESPMEILGLPGSRLRPEVVAFAFQMEDKLRKKDGTWGSGWKTADARALLDMLDAHVEKLRHDVEHPIKGRLGLSAADVGNFAMMISDVCGGLSDRT